MKRIPMDAESIAGILSGIKHETSRVIVPQPRVLPNGNMSWQRGASTFGGMADCVLAAMMARCPYSVGDIVAVTERWRPVYRGYPLTERVKGVIQYQSDGVVREIVLGAKPCTVYLGGLWRPPFLMRADQSRITIEITSRDAARVQSLTYMQIEAEGYQQLVPRHGIEALEAATDWWQRRWDGINAKRGYPYESNPWAWRYGFKVLEVKK